MAYSLDLRERIVATVKEGVNQPEVAERFRVSLSSVERYLRRERQGELRAKPPPGRPASISIEAYEALAGRSAQRRQLERALRAVAQRARDERQRVRHVPGVAAG